MKDPAHASKQVAGVMLLREDGSLLMQHRDNKPGLPYADHWSIPSGRIEAGESPENCARREMLEETGYRCTDLTPFAVISGREDTGADYELHVFWSFDDGRQEIRCREGQAIQFIERARAASYPMPPFIDGVWERAIKEIIHPSVGR